MMLALVVFTPFVGYIVDRLSPVRSYALDYGSTLFVILFVTAATAIIATLALCRSKLFPHAVATSLIAVSAVVAMCLPTEARSLRQFFSHESRQSRLVENFSEKLSKDSRFQNIDLSYWHGKGEGCIIRGTVGSQEDLSMLENIVKAKTGLYIDSEVEIVRPTGQLTPAR